MLRIKKIIYRTTITIFSLTMVPNTAYPTASTDIWAPNTDTQPWGTGHITADTYIPVRKNSDGGRARTITNSGLTFGMLPFKKLTAEAGFDYKTGYGDMDYRYPIYFNAKLAIPEDAYGPCFPAIAGGIYDLGTQRYKTDYDTVYIKAAKTPVLGSFSLGRISFGYFWGNNKLLLDQNQERDSNGIFCSWARTISEISDRLWVCVEYQGTKSSYGVLNLGFSWQFAKDISVLTGYQFYNNKNLAGTATVQVDINF
jgi:hypothetical protein